MGKVTGMIHSGITVRNMEKSLKFYRDLLGLKVKSSQLVREDYVKEIVEVTGLQEIYIVFLELPDGHVFEVLEYRGPHTTSGAVPPHYYGAGHICLEVQGLEGLIEELEANGIKFRSKGIVSITKGANKGAKAIYVHDPDHYIIELMEKPI